ncbi:MAG: hypothetical protein JSV63_00380 [Candidatus Aenigmatarchaeota archaeon]|nr:MAG: hypothetical protein JSV63_00380 [Candidatus Aenigmarchaeota archaeon]
MLEKCSNCGRRLRLKVKCLERGGHLCKKCCELKEDHCQYHLFCWNNLL